MIGRARAKREGRRRAFAMQVRCQCLPVVRFIRFLRKIFYRLPSSEIGVVSRHHQHQHQTIKQVNTQQQHTTEYLCLYPVDVSHSKFVQGSV